MNLKIEVEKPSAKLCLGDIVVVEFKNTGTFIGIVSKVDGDFVLRSVDGLAKGFSGNESLEDLMEDIVKYGASYTIYPQSEYELILRRK